MNPIILFATGLFCFALGAIVSLASWRKPALANNLGNAFALLGSLVLFLSALAAIAGGTTVSFEVSGFVRFPLRIDTLAATFLLLISLLSFVCSLYAFGYVKHYYG